MRRTALLIAVMMLAVLVSSGVAWAAIIRCDGGVCRGTGGPDQMTGTIGTDTMYAFGGHDRMDGGRGEDRMYGMDGADTMSGGYRSDSMYGGDHNDVMSGGHNPDRMFGGPGTDTIQGDSGNDYINIAGDAQNDFVNCGTGAGDLVVLNAQELNPPNLSDFIAQTDCERIRIALR